MTDAAPDCPGTSRRRSRRRLSASDSLREGRVFGVSAQVYGLRRDGAGRVWRSGHRRLHQPAAARRGGRARGRRDGRRSIRCTRCSRTTPNARAPIIRQTGAFSIRWRSTPSTCRAELLTDAVRAEFREAWLRRQPCFRRSNLVDYSAVSALKNRLFDVIHAAFRARRLAAPDDALVMEYERFVVAGGESLRRFAIFTAIERTLGGTLGQVRGRARFAACAGRREPSRASTKRKSRARNSCSFSPTGNSRRRPRPLTRRAFRSASIATSPSAARPTAPRLFRRANRLMAGVSIGAPPDPLGPQGPNLGPAALRSARARPRRLRRFRAPHRGEYGLCRHPAHRPCARLEAPVSRAGGRRRLVTAPISPAPSKRCSDR